MQTPTGDVLEAFKRVAARPEGQAIHGFLQESMRDVSKRLVQERDPVGLRIWQGQAQVLDVLLQAWKP